MIRKRKRLNKKAKITNDEIDWSNFQRIRNKCINYVRSSKKKFLEKQINKVDSIHTISTKQWWKTIKNLIRLPNKKSFYPTLIFNNQNIESDSDKANYFKDFFCAQSSVHDSNTVLTILKYDEMKKRK